MSHRVRFWLDLDKKGRWGIECDDPRLTFDGHYVAVQDDPDGDPEKLRGIVQTLNMYLPPQRKED